MTGSAVSDKNADTQSAARVLFDRRGDEAIIQAQGTWTVTHSVDLDAALQLHLAREQYRSAYFDLSGVQVLDTAGAWLLYRTIREIEGAGGTAQIGGGKPEHLSLLEAIAAADRPQEAPEPRVHWAVEFLSNFGRNAEEFAGSMVDALGFCGVVLEAIGRAILRPSRLRVTSLVYLMEQAGLNAVPIVSLMSFLIGAVLAYQGAGQLERFGAEPFTINLVSVSVMREIGILLTAIMVAGRSGSAFTAQIGSMKMREEIDAIRTLGLDPVEILVLPRVLALVFTLPLLGFVSVIVGLFGGGVVTFLLLDISPASYVTLLRESVDVWTFLVGIIKAPVFAFLIALIGCFEGLRVTGTAESVGQRTTQSVVEGIFVVIIADAVFSIIFVELGI